MERKTSLFFASRVIFSNFPNRACYGKYIWIRRAVNRDSSLHLGQKYARKTVRLSEHLYNQG